MKTFLVTIVVAILTLTVIAVVTLALADGQPPAEHSLLPSLKDPGEGQDQDHTEDENKDQPESREEHRRQGDTHDGHGWHRRDAEIDHHDNRYDRHNHPRPFRFLYRFLHPYSSGYAFAPPNGGYGNGYGYGGGGRVPYAGFGSCYPLMLAAERTGEPSFWNDFNACMAGPH